MARNLTEKMSDQFLLVYLLSDLHKRTPFIYETKIHKLGFLSEKDMIENNEKGFNYRFIKLYHGPYSQELTGDLNDFAESEIIDVRPSNRGALIVPGLQCKRILDDFGALALRNRDFLRRISDVNKRYGAMGLERLLKTVYRMKSPISKDKKRSPIIENLSIRTPLSKSIPPQLAGKVFSITPEEVVTLEIYMDKKAFESLAQATKSAKNESFLGFEEVF